MFDFGFGELLIIGVTALIIIGPKDLPGVFRAFGRFTGKMRRMAREFSRAMEEAADEAGVKEAANAVKGATNPSKFGLDKLNEAADKFDKWEPTKPETKKNLGPETAKLSEERAEAAKKIHEYSAKKSAEKRAAEKAAAEAEAPAEQPKDSA